MKRLLLIGALAGCGSTAKTFGGGVGAIAAGSLLNELSARTEEPARTPLQVVALPTLFAGIVMVSTGFSLWMHENKLAMD